MKRILCMSLLLISTVYGMEGTSDTLPSGSHPQHEKSQPVTFEDIKKQFAIYENPSALKPKIIFALTHLIQVGSLKDDDKAEAINIAKKLGAANLAIRLQKYNQKEDFGNLNKLPEDIVKFIIHSAADGSSPETIKNLLLVNKSFNAAMLTAPVSFDFSIPAPYGTYDPIMGYYESDYKDNDAVNDHTIEVLVQIFPNMRELNLMQSNITDVGLSYLKGARNLQSLNLRNCKKITAVGLKELGHFINLRSLNLSFLPVTGEILKDLSNLKNLETLAFRWGKFTDQDLMHLIELKKNLKRLGLPYCHNITSEGFTNFLQSMELIALDLSNNPQITDETVGGLNKEIKFLNLETTPVTSDGISALSHMDDLTFLRLMGNSALSQETLTELFTKFPHLTIIDHGKKLVANEVIK